MSINILLVGRSRAIHRKIKDKEINATLLVDMNKITKEKLAPDYSRVVAFDNHATDEDWIEVAAALHSVKPFTCIGAFTENREEIAAKIGKRLGIPVHSEMTVRLTHEKNELREELKKFHLDDTSCMRLKQGTSPEKIIEAIEMIGYPAIVKPANARGSLAVRKILNRSEIKKVLSEFGELAGSYDILIESLLVGREFSVETFSEARKHKLICVTEKFKDDQTSIEVGHLVPARITQDEYLRIKEFVFQVLNIIGVENGPAHTELFLTKNGPRIVESHTRLGGDKIPNLIGYLSGIDLEDAWIDQVVGKSVIERIPEIDGSVKTSTWASVQYRILSSPGVISKIDQKEIPKDSKIKTVESLLSVGDKVTAVAVDSFSRAVEATAIGPNPDSAIEEAENALDLVHVEVTE